MNVDVEVEREEDGRWLAEIPALPGVMAYGVTSADAVAKVQAIRQDLERPHGSGAIACWPPFVYVPWGEERPGPRMQARIDRIQAKHQAFLDEIMRLRSQQS